MDFVLFSAAWNEKKCAIFDKCVGYCDNDIIAMFYKPFEHCTFHLLCTENIFFFSICALGKH